MSIVDTLQAKIKEEMGDFMRNQQVLIDIGKKIKYIKDPNLKTQLQYTYDKLSAIQKSLETEAMNWITQMSNLQKDIEFKQQETKQSTLAIITSDISSYSQQLFNLTNQGLKLSGLLLNQNNEVRRLQESVEAQKIMLPKTPELLIKMLYGVGGIIALYFIISLKKKSRKI
jgi:hypothetical protein